MDDKARFDKLLITAREMAVWVLNEAGVIFPMAVWMSADGAEVKAYFPRDDHPDADWAALLAAAVETLRKRAEQEQIGGVALIAPLENDGNPGVGIQVETEGKVLLLIFPYERLRESYVMGEPLSPDTLLADGILQTDE
jgi:hypothetical protein